MEKDKVYIRQWGNSPLQYAAERNYSVVVPERWERHKAYRC